MDCLLAECAGEDDFRCDNGQCVDQWERCDGVPNCNDGSDESKDACEQGKLTNGSH